MLNILCLHNDRNLLNKLLDDVRSFMPNSKKVL
jgi:hypothetical protein